MPVNKIVSREAEMFFGLTTLITKPQKFKGENIVKISALTAGIGLMILSGAVCLGCLIAPAMTNGRASFEESMMVFVATAVLFVVAALLTIVFAVKGKKTSA